MGRWPRCPKKLASTIQGKTPPFEEWLPWPGFTTEPGWYYYDGELNEIRDEFLRHSLVPRQSMLDFVSIRKLSVGKVVVQRVPKDWQVLKKIAEMLGMPWAGQGLPSVSQAALLFFLRPKREPCRKHYETLLAK